MSYIKVCDKCDKSEQELRIYDDMNFNAKGWAIITALSLEIGNVDFCICEDCLVNLLQKELKNSNKRTRDAILNTSVNKGLMLKDYCWFSLNSNKKNTKDVKSYFLVEETSMMWTGKNKIDILKFADDNHLRIRFIDHYLYLLEDNKISFRYIDEGTTLAATIRHHVKNMKDVINILEVR